MAYKLAQLAVNPRGKSEMLSRIFLSQPTMEEEQLLGKLFVLAEIANNKTDVMLANFVIDRLNLFYYQNEQIPLLARLATITPSDIFESALAKTNQEVVNFLDTEKLSFTPRNFNLTIGVIYKQKIYFSNLGHNKALLIYKPKIRNNRQVNDYNLLNVGLSTADPTQDVILADKLFTNTINGSLPAGAYFVFANEALYEFLSEKQLIKIVTTLPPAGAVEQIKNILEQTNIFLPFTGLIIKSQEQAKNEKEWAVPIVDPRVKAEPSSVWHTLEPSRNRAETFRQERDINKESIKTFNRTTEKTAQILRPPGFVNALKIKTWLKYFKLPLLTRSQNKIIIKRANLTWLRREGWLSVKKIGAGLAKLFTIIFWLLNSIWQLLSRPEKRQAAQAKLVAARARLKRRHLITLGVIVCIVIALGFSLYLTGRQKTERARSEAWQTAKEQFEQKEKEVATDLIYDNKDKAQLSLELMSVLIADLEKNTDPDKTIELATLKSRYQDLADRISGLIRLNDPEKIFSLEPNSQAGFLATNAEWLYVVTNKKINGYNLITKTKQTILDSADDLRPLNIDRQGTFFVLAGQKLLALNGTDIKTRNITDLPSSLSQATVYNNRLYVIDGSSGQILRYQLADTMQSPTPWLAIPLSSSAQGLAIDLSVFVLQNNQEIWQYDNGLGQALSLANVFPALTETGSFNAPLNTDILALVDKPTKRLIVYSRSGKLLGQYTANAWNSINGLTISPDGREAYVLSGDEVYKVRF